MSVKMQRRSFLKGTAAAAAAVSFTPWSKVLGASEQVRAAVIGFRGRGGAHLGGVLGQKDRAKLVALCDVDSKVLQKGVAEYSKRTKANVDGEVDMRKLFDRKDIDVVFIATPNHWHSLAAIWAMQAGKDVYVEKPVSHNIWEGRQAVLAARKYNRICQAGTQSRSSKHIANAVKWVQDGNLGKILYAVGTCFKPRQSIGKLDQPLEIPAEVDYDLWCGPAEKLPLYRKAFHYDWHWMWNTGNGDLGNQGIHQADIARWFLGEKGLPPRVFSVGGRFGYVDAGETPNTQLAVYDYAKAPIVFEVRGLPQAKEFQDQRWARKMDKYMDAGVGVIIHCEGGHVLVPNYNSAIAKDKDGKIIKTFSSAADKAEKQGEKQAEQAAEKPESVIEEKTTKPGGSGDITVQVSEGNHFENFFNAVRSRKVSELKADIEQGHVSSALCHIANISHRLGAAAPQGQIREQVKSQPYAAEAFARIADHLKANEVDIDTPTLTLGAVLELDVKKERFTNSEEANALLTRKYRKGFEVPDIAKA